MTVEELKVILELETKGFNRDTSQVKRDLDGVSSVAQRVKDRLRKIFSGQSGANNTAREYRNLENQIQKTERTISELISKQNALGDKGKVPTEAYSALQEQIKTLQDDFDRLLKQEEEWLSIGVDPESFGFKTLDNQLTTTGNKIKALEEKIKALEASGGAFIPSAKFQELQDKIDSAKGELGRYKEEQASVGEADGGFATIKEKIKGVAERFKSLGEKARSVGGKIKAFASLFSLFRRRAQAAGSGIKNFIKSAIGIGSLVMLFNRLKSAMREGFSNLSQYSSQTSSDLARLKGSLTQVKDSLAVAFAPILTVVAPLIQTLVNYITAACNALAMFFGALTGQKTITIAKSGLGDIAAGASDAADATGGANDAAKDYQRTLMGFDQINKLDDKSGSGGSGAGGVGGAAGFATEEVANTFSSWADKMKEAWANADFSELGQIVGTKIRNALDSIDWDRIKGVGERIAKSIATGLNGFLETPGLFASIGKTIAESINTAFNTANTFATSFHWESLGRAISDSINSFFSTFDFKLAGQTVFNWASGILRSAIEAVRNVKWEEVGSKIGEFLTSINWPELISKAIELAGLVIKGVAKFAIGFIKSIASGILEWLYNLVKKRNAANVKVAFNGKENPSFSRTKAKYDSLENETVTKTIKGGKDAYGTFDNTTKAYNNVKDNTVTKTVKGKTDSTYINTQATYSKLVDKSATISVKGTIDGNVKTIKSLLDAKVSKVFNFIAKGSSITMTPTYQAEGGLFVNGSWKPITAAAGGGTFSMGQMFVAREAGPELVGTIGGHTAVMNNNQIVSSVADGVYKAVLSAFSQTNNDSNVSVVLEGDAQGLFRVIRTEARNYTNATGLAAFPV